MRIHLPLHPEHFVVPDAGPSAPPLARIGGELVVVELQGELGWEGEKAGGVIGVLGLDRPDHPTLHIGQHHLLHGKMANLPRPYAVIRKAVAASGNAIEGDIAEEESDEEHEAEEAVEAEKTPKKRKVDTNSALPNGQMKLEEEAEGEDDAPPFPDAFTTPEKSRPAAPASSSPWEVPSSARDYSSDLDSSPVQGLEEDDSDDDEAAQAAREEERRRRQKEEERRKRRRAERPERTRHYEVVGVVRKKVVFALRPEPLVQPTPLPE